MYLASLNRINTLDIGLILPGHRELIKNSGQRIAELKHHHEHRLHEITDILGAGLMTAYEVASRMHWDIRYKHWGQFPSFQRWFATGEAIAHLEHLVCRGDAQKSALGAQIGHMLSK